MVCSIGHWIWHFEQMRMANELLDKRIIQGEIEQEEEMLKALRIAAGCLTEMHVDCPSSTELAYIFI